LHKAIGGYAAGILRLIGESYGRETLQTGWQEFNIEPQEPFCGFHANAELFYSWLLHTWAPARERGHVVLDETLFGTPPTRAYLERRSSSLNPLLRLYLESCLGTWARFYEVLDCEVGVGFRASEVFTGAISSVSDSLASITVEAGEILYANLIPIGELTVMDAISPRSFPSHSKTRLLRLCQKRNNVDSDGSELRKVYFALSAMESS
jgi:hypothetical protein